MAIANEALGNRFGARILIVFAICSIVPVLVFSALAYTSTQKQLDDDAIGGLRREAKAASMAIFERLEIASAHLGLIAGGRDLETPRTTRVFDSVEFVPMGSLDLAPRQFSSLLSGNTVLFQGTGTDGRSRLGLVRQEGESAVVGTLNSSFLYAPKRVGAGERYWVTDAEGSLLFSTSASGSPLAIQSHLQTGPIREPFELAGPGGSEIALRWPIFLMNGFGYPELTIGISRELSSVHRPLRDFRLSFAASVLLALLFSAGVAIWQIRLRVGPLESLLGTTAEIERGNLSARSDVRSGDEFDVLAHSINSMAANLERTFGTISRLRSVADSLLRAKTASDVSEQVIPAVLHFTGASQASVLLLDSPSSAGAGSLHEVCEGKDSSFAVSDERAVWIREALASAAQVVEFRSDGGSEEFWQSIDEWRGFRVEAYVVLPLVSGAGEASGVLEICFDDVHEREAILEAVDSSLAILAHQAGGALVTVKLISDLRGLFEGVVGLTVDAIDKKSPYTGDHCRRVPILTEMIADAACEEEVGRLKEFVLSEDERYELKIAALLHDCGKVSTPVHVMDKATKLERIEDRIELVRLRTEILRRDLERDALIAHLEQLGCPSLDDSAWREEARRLEEDLAFVERCNVGGEFMADSDLERIASVSRRYEWRNQEGRSRPLLTEDEVMNLRIRRGTLNPGEREIINEHVVTTIQLLERLPFPPEMKNVPAIAGAHHEHVDGTGYPLGLSGEALSVQGRILGLADVFEALTAIDRPYKKGKTLTETLEIMERMVEERHLDRDLHDAFVRQRVYLRYAIAHMRPEQIDGVHRDHLEEMTSEWAPLPL